VADAKRDAAHAAPLDGWEQDLRVKRLKGLAATAAQRLAWLEEAIALAHRSGALPRRRGPDGRTSG